MSVPEAIRSGPTWVVATESTGRRWSEALTEGGLARVVSLCWGAARPTVTRAQVDAAIERVAPDLILLTSQEALACLGEAPVPGWEAVSIGDATCAAARARGFAAGAEATGATEESSGKFLATLVSSRTFPPRRALWLRGREARAEVADAFRAKGIEVQELVTYAVDELEGFHDALRSASDPVAVAIGSPRGAEALAGALRKAERGLPVSVTFLTMGRTTEKTLASLGFGDHPRMRLRDVFGARQPRLPSAE